MLITFPYIKGIPEFMQAVLARLLRTILRERSSARFSVCWVDWSRLGSLLTWRRRAKRRGLVSLRDVTPMDPQELTRVRQRAPGRGIDTFPECPVTWRPGIIRAAIPVSRAPIIKSIVVKEVA